MPSIPTVREPDRPSCRTADPDEYDPPGVLRGIVVGLVPAALLWLAFALLAWALW